MRPPELPPSGAQWRNRSMSCEPLPLNARGCWKETSSPTAWCPRGTSPRKHWVKDVMGVPPPRGAAGEERQGHNPRQVIPSPRGPDPASKRNELKTQDEDSGEASDTLNCLLKTQLRPCCHESRPKGTRRNPVSLRPQKQCHHERTPEY